MSAGGYIAGPTDGALMVRPADGELIVRTDGTVLRCHHCEHGYHFEPTGERIDMEATRQRLDQLNQ